MIDVDLNAVAIPLDWTGLFGREAATDVEIGSGKGRFLLSLAASHPERNLLAVERAGHYHRLCCERAAKRGLSNIRLLRTTAEDLLYRLLAPSSIDTLFILFPDPWPKKRHHKRRIVQPAFVDLVARKLKTGGRFRLATDWQNYAEQMLEVASSCAALENEFDAGYAPRPDSRPLTRFENRGQRLGHGVWDLSFRKR